MLANGLVLPDPRVEEVPDGIRVEGIGMVITIQQHIDFTDPLLESF